MGITLNKPTGIEDVNDRLQRILSIHLDPSGGSLYWLERQRALGLDLQREIRSVRDLHLLGPMDEQALAQRPIEDFVPRSLHHTRSAWVTSQTAGTLGAPKHAVHRQDEFEAAFVTPFTQAAAMVAFPREANWLFVGPSGPHIIGKAARACAAAMGSADPFTLDLDPRWAKKLPRGSFAWERYVAHIQEQAMTILDSQRIGVLFSTPVVLENLGLAMSAAQREAILGLHLGGISVSASQRTLFVQMFPRAVILSGYGNSLFGVMPELAWSAQTGFDYFPHSTRLILRVIPLDAGPRHELREDAPSGERGQVVVTRLDELQMIVNMIERDSAILIRPPESSATAGFVLNGLREPQPIMNQVMRPTTGLY